MIVVPLLGLAAMAQELHRLGAERGISEHAQPPEAFSCRQRHQGPHTASPLRPEEARVPRFVREPSRSAGPRHSRRRAQLEGHQIQVIRP